MSERITEALAALNDTRDPRFAAYYGPNPPQVMWRAYELADALDAELPALLVEIDQLRAQVNPIFPAPPVGEYVEAHGEIDIGSVVRWSGRLYRVRGIYPKEAAPFYALDGGPTVGCSHIVLMKPVSSAEGAPCAS